MYCTEDEGKIRYLEEPGLQIVELPYRGNEISMVIILPSEKNGLIELEKSLTLEQIFRWIDGLKTSRVDSIRVYLPWFANFFTENLLPPLKAMGLKRALCGCFCGEANSADFSGAIELEPHLHSTRRVPYLSQFSQDRLFMVNFDGTETACRTPGIRLYSTRNDPVARVVRVDHPYLFIVWHKPTNAILFIGRRTMTQWLRN
jgi:serine protease inhibitor